MPPPGPALSSSPRLAPSCPAGVHPPLEPPPPPTGNRRHGRPSPHLEAIGPVSQRLGSPGTVTRPRDAGLSRPPPPHVLLRRGLLPLPRQRSPHSSSWVGRSQRAQARHRGNGAPHSLLGKEGGTGPVHPPRPEPRDRRLRPRRTQGARGDPGSPQARPGAATPTHPLPPPPPLHIHERAPAPALATPTLPHPPPTRESGGPGAAWPSGPRRGGTREAPCPAPATVMFTIERALERLPPLPASWGAGGAPPPGRGDPPVQRGPARPTAEPRTPHPAAAPGTPQPPAVPVTGRHRGLARSRGAGPAPGREAPLTGPGPSRRPLPPGREKTPIASASTRGRH